MLFEHRVTIHYINGGGCNIGQVCDEEMKMSFSHFSQNMFSRYKITEFSVSFLGIITVSVVGSGLTCVRVRFTSNISARLQESRKAVPRIM